MPRKQHSAKQEAHEVKRIVHSSKLKIIYIHNLIVLCTARACIDGKMAL